MKKKLFFMYSITLSLFTIPVMSQSYEWGGHFGGFGEDVVSDLFVDDTGNSYTTGYFTDSADFDPGEEVFEIQSNGASDVFVQKIDQNGNLVWAKNFGGNNGDYGLKVTVDANGNVYVCGAFMESADFDPGDGSHILTSNGEQDIFVVKLNAQGDFVWARSFGSINYEDAVGIGNDAAGNVYVTGYFQETINFDTTNPGFELNAVGGLDGYVLKLNTNGELIWVKRIGGNGFDISSDLIVSDAGEVFVSGSFQETVDFNPDGTEEFLLSVNGNMAGFVLHLNNEGSFIKAIKTSDSSSWVYGMNFDVDNNDNIYVTGFYAGDATFVTQTGDIVLTSLSFDSGYVLKINNSGGLAWVKNIDGGEGAYCHGVAVDSGHEVYIMGFYGDSLNLGPVTITKIEDTAFENFVAILDNQGNFINAWQLGGANDLDTCRIALKDDALYLASAFQTECDINPISGEITQVTPYDYRDNYIVKLNDVLLATPQNHLSKVMLYPNPVTDYLNITSEMINENDFFEVYSMLGKVVLSGTINNQKSIDLTQLSIGIYNLKLGDSYFKIAKK
jgi:hypothetical protein